MFWTSVTVTLKLPHSIFTAYGSILHDAPSLSEMTAANDSKNRRKDSATRYRSGTCSIAMISAPTCVRARSSARLMHAEYVSIAFRSSPMIL